MSDSQSSGADADNDSSSSSSSNSGSDVVMNDAAAVTAVAAPTKIAAPKKKKTAYAESGDVKMLFTASALKPAVHELGCHIAGSVPALVNVFLVHTLKYYGTRPNAAFSTAPSSSLSIELKPTLVDAFVGQFTLTSKRRTEVKLSAKHACAFMLETAVAICKSQSRKTVSDTDVVTACQITKNVIKCTTPVVPAAAATPAEPAHKKAKTKKAAVAVRPKKGAVVSHAVADDGDDAAGAVKTSGPNVPPPKKKKRAHAELSAAIEE